MNDIPQDMFILCLLHHIPVKSTKNKKLLKKLGTKYTDYEAFEKDVIKRLNQLGLLDSSNKKETTQKKDPCSGKPLNEMIDVTVEVYTTNQKGISALKNNRFDSEIKSINIRKRNMYISITATIIAIIGGLSGIVATIYNVRKAYKTGTTECLQLKDTSFSDRNIISVNSNVDTIYSIKMGGLALDSVYLAPKVNEEER